VPETARLILRRWGPDDREPFAALNADPQVKEYFPSALTRQESDELIDRIEAGFVARGFGLWALELKSTGRMIGFTGLSVPSFDAAFTPAVEIGWRLARGAWGNGFATEAAEECLSRGFTEHDLS
jgi:RimJ/RimL family protein N-acetyltransferase